MASAATLLAAAARSRSVVLARSTTTRSSSTCLGLQALLRQPTTTLNNNANNAFCSRVGMVRLSSYFTPGTFYVTLPYLTLRLLECCTVRDVCFCVASGGVLVVWVVGSMMWHFNYLCRIIGPIFWF